MNLPSYLKKFSSRQLRLPGVIGFLLLGLANSLQAQAKSQDLALLRQQAETYLFKHYQSDKNERLEIKLGFFDRRLNLAACEQELAFSLQDTAGPGGNVTVNCQCQDAESGWTYHLPAQVDIYRPVLVASAQIARGDLLDINDLSYETHNISQISDPISREDVVGKAAKRLINAGDIIRPALLDQPKAISRGETVSITARSGSIRVVMQGTAMTDGKLGQHIRVRNNQSDRIISARVVGQAAVEIL